MIGIAFYLAVVFVFGVLAAAIVIGAFEVVLWLLRRRIK